MERIKHHGRIEQGKNGRIYSLGSNTEEEKESTTQQGNGSPSNGPVREP